MLRNQIKDRQITVFVCETACLVLKIVPWEYKEKEDVSDRSIEFEIADAEGDTSTGMVETEAVRNDHGRVF